MQKGYGSNLIEIEASRDDSYNNIISHASKVLRIRLDGKKLCLFKPSTACVPNMELTVKSCKKKWTLGNYLLAEKKVPSQVKFGVGYMYEKHHQEQPVSNLVVELHFCVMHLNVVPNRNLPLVGKEELVISALKGMCRM